MSFMSKEWIRSGFGKQAYTIYEQILVWLGLVWFWIFQALSMLVNVTSKLRISLPGAKCGT